MNRLKKMCLLLIAIIGQWQLLCGQKITGLTATASSGNASLAVDNNTSTRWESAFSDPQWIVVDLGAEYPVNKVIIRWEAANAKNYTLEASTNGTDYTVLATKTNMGGGNRIDTLSNLSVTARYIKINGTERNLTYGYSIWEIEVYQQSAPVLTSMVILPNITQTMKVGSTMQFTAQGLDQNNDPIALTDSVIWIISDSINQISASGMLTANKPGFVTITAKSGTLTATKTVEIEPADPNIALHKTVYTSSGNGTLAVDNNTGTRWESAFSDPQYIMVDLGEVYHITGIKVIWETANAKNYTITAGTDTSAMLTLVSASNMPVGPRTDAWYDSVSGNFRFIRINGIARNTGYGYSIWELKIFGVEKQFANISWNVPDSIVYGKLLDSTILNATANIAGTFVYNPSYGTKLFAGKNQQLMVDFYPADTVFYKKTSLSVNIDVLKANPIINWPTPMDIVYGTPIDSTQLNATADVPGNFNYQPGLGTILNAGTNRLLSVVFVPNDTANYNTVETTVAINILKATPQLSWIQPAAITYGTALSTDQLNASANIEGTYIYNPQPGTVLSAGKGQTLMVIFTPSDTINYESVQASVTLDVNKATPLITWNNPDPISVGTALSEIQLNATATTEGEFLYSPAAGTLLPVGRNQLLSVTFTPADTMNYTTASKTVYIDVVSVLPQITWNTPADIVYGTPLDSIQLNATVNAEGILIYEPSAGTVLNAGKNQILKVTFIPNDTINVARTMKTVTINVLKATPRIEWSKPADIIEGTALSNDQLNATANVEGTFAYDPAAGTIMQAGNNQKLHVAFTPADTINYEIVTAEVSINVIPKVAVANENLQILSVFPNPFVDYIMVKGVSGKNISYSVATIDGKIVQSGTISGNLIRLSTLTSGWYILKVNEGNTIHSFHILKK